jgi:hypothetical protein
MYGKDNRWTPEDIANYERAIRKAHEQREQQAERKDKWLNDFIDGKPVKQFDNNVD